MADVALDQLVGDQVRQQALQLVEVQLGVPPGQRHEEQIQVDEVCVVEHLQLGSSFDSIGDALHEVLERDHAQALDHGEDARPDVLVLVPRDRILECLHFAITAGRGQLRILDEAVAVEELLRWEASIDHLDGDEVAQDALLVVHVLVGAVRQAERLEKLVARPH